MLDGDVLDRFFGASAFVLVVFRLDSLTVLLVEDVGISEEYESQDRLTVFVGCKVRAGTKHIGGVPKFVFKFFEFGICHF